MKRSATQILMPDLKCGGRGAVLAPAKVVQIPRDGQPVPYELNLDFHVGRWLAAAAKPITFLTVDS